MGTKNKKHAAKQSGEPEAVPDENAIAADAPAQKQERQKPLEWRALAGQLPPLTQCQLAAIEELLVDSGRKGIRAGRSVLGTDNRAENATNSVWRICRSMQAHGQDTHVSLHGSFVSGLIADDSDINLSLSMDGKDRKHFVNKVFPAIVNEPDFRDLILCESPTRLARIEGDFLRTKITIDWQNNDGVKLSELLALYNNLHEDVLPLRQIVRNWAEKCGLTDKDKLASQHAVPPVLLDLMLIHSLQQSKRLPCIHEIRKESGRDALDKDLKDILASTPSDRWNLAEVFIEFLEYFSRGDAKQYFIRITSTERASKTDSKFNEKYMHVMDPIRDQPIASFQKHFLQYFINCFLASYVYFRVPRVRGEEGPESTALVDVELYQPDSQPPQKKKSDKEGEPVLQSTTREFSIELKEYDRDKVTAQLEGLRNDDYVYSFEDSAALTAGFKCDLHCRECESIKHLTADCPQLFVPPLLELSRDHWKPHYADELDRIICRTFESARITPARQRDLKEVLGRLRNAIRKQLTSGDVRLDAYGSSESGFGSNTSDFDICFRYGEGYDVDGGERSEERQSATISAIESALRNSTQFTRVLAVTGARIPIVQFETRVGRGEIEGDISYYNELALHNTRLLKRYCSWTKDDVLAKLGIFIKRWAAACDIGDAAKGSLSSYALIILAIHFLQQLQPSPLLPVLHEMGEKKEVVVDGWDVYFCDDEPEPSWSQCPLSVGELFLQFLDYYAKFDWQNQVVQISRSSKLTKIERGWRNQMCIEDPFELSRNLGSGVRNRMFAFIKKAFVISREIFNRLDERSELMMKWKTKDDHDMTYNEIEQYGAALLSACHGSLGWSPREKQCLECGGWGHFAVECKKRAAARGDVVRGRGRGGRGGWTRAATTRGEYGGERGRGGANGQARGGGRASGETGRGGRGRGAASAAAAAAAARERGADSDQARGGSAAAERGGEGRGRGRGGAMDGLARGGAMDGLARGGGRDAAAPSGRGRGGGVAGEDRGGRDAPSGRDRGAADGQPRGRGRGGGEGRLEGRGRGRGGSMDSLARGRGRDAAAPSGRGGRASREEPRDRMREVRERLGRL